MLNRIFVAKKPLFMSSNAFLNTLKRKYSVKKAGFSGILDPFACGVMIIAFGQYTKIFPFLNKEPKVYQATLWLGLQSDSLDLENVRKIDNVKRFEENYIKDLLQSFTGSVRFKPPKYSAKKIGGIRAYKLARKQQESLLEAGLKEQEMQIHKIEFLNYAHPFLSFKVWVSEGAYVRSLGELIARELGCAGGLSYLERISEGGLRYEGERSLNPLEIIPFKRLDLRDKSSIYFHIQNGQKINPKVLKIYENGKYLMQFEDFFSIISVKDENLQYLANRIPLC